MSFAFAKTSTNFTILTHHLELFGQNSGNDTVSDVYAAEYIIDLSFAPTAFTRLADVTAAAFETTQNGQSGVLIDLGVD